MYASRNKTEHIKAFKNILISLYFFCFITCSIYIFCLRVVIFFYTVIKIDFHILKLYVFFIHNILRTIIIMIIIYDYFYFYAFSVFFSLKIKTICLNKKIILSKEKIYSLLGEKKRSSLLNLNYYCTILLKYCFKT